MTATIVQPVIVQEWADASQATMAPEFRDQLFIVDNTKHNRGFPRSINLGIQKMRQDDTDWLVMCSAAIRFREPGGMDFLAGLDAHSDHIVLEATPVFGWHLIAFSRATVELVGYVDENLGPHSYNDLDYSLRIQRAHSRFIQPFWSKIPVDCDDAGMAHSINLGGVRDDAGRCISYMISKWGGADGEIHPFIYPFNDPTKSLRFWPACANGTWDMDVVPDVVND